MQGLGSRFLHELVDQSDVGKRPSCHHGIVATTSSVRVELPRGQPTPAEEQCVHAHNTQCSREQGNAIYTCTQW